jgi:hypothetical protein
MKCFAFAGTRQDGVVPVVKVCLVLKECILREIAACQQQQQADTGLGKTANIKKPERTNSFGL